MKRRPYMRTAVRLCDPDGKVLTGDPDVFLRFELHDDGYWHAPVHTFTVRAAGVLAFMHIVSVGTVERSPTCVTVDDTVTLERPRFVIKFP